MKQAAAISLFLILIAIAVLGGFASRSLLDQASEAATSAQSTLSKTYSDVPASQEGLEKLFIGGAICLLASRWRWKASDRS